MELASIMTTSMDSQAFVDQHPKFIYPYKTSRRIWEYVMFFLSMFCIWELPFEWFFDVYRSFWYIFPSLIIDLVYFIDIFIVVKTAYLRNGVIIFDKAQIIQNVGKWRLCIYFLSALPYYLIGWFLKDDVVFRVLVSLKLLRFLRLFDAQRRINDTLVYISPISKMIILFAWLFTIAHYCACVFWFTGFLEIPERSWLAEADIITKPRIIQYFHTLYYITTTILTIGYGDLHPYTFPEVCVVICIEVVGVFFYNYVVSNMVSIVADPTRNTFLNKYQRIHAAFKSRGVTDESMDELLRYYDYVWERGRDHTEIYATSSKLPETLQKKLNLSIHKDVFTRVEALRGADEDVLEKVSMALRAKIFTPGDFIVKAGRVSNRIFFVTEGKIEVTNTNGQNVATLDGSSGYVFGDQSMLTGLEEVASAIAATYVEAFELLKEDFNEIVEAHPQFKSRLQRMHTKPKD